jgi:phosphoribosylpyrophosphate synthetase
LAGSVWTGVERRFPVRKSATALNADRPTVRQHYESFAVFMHSMSTRPPLEPVKLVLIDDVITKGRTILAAAARLHEAFPNADIRAFALIRTMGFLAKIDDPCDPCQGEVRWSAQDARREP